MPTLLNTARGYVAAGLSVIPIRCDGDKRPAVSSWNPYRERHPTDDELTDWFGHVNGVPVGLAVVCGTVSRNLEVVDFDCAYTWGEWSDAVLAIDPHALDAIPRVRTPSGGVHLYLFRETAGPNRKLARRRDGKTLIEVRGEGGYVLAPGCPPGCHKTGKSYVWEVPPGAEEPAHA